MDINHVSKPVLIDHLLPYLDDGSQNIMSGLSRHHEDIIPNKKNKKNKKYLQLINVEEKATINLIIFVPFLVMVNKL